MPEKPLQREAFVVWVWWKADQTIAEIWVQHVSSGKAVILHDLKEVIAFITASFPKIEHQPPGLR